MRFKFYRNNAYVIEGLYHRFQHRVAGIHVLPCIELFTCRDNRIAWPLCYYVIGKFFAFLDRNITKPKRDGTPLQDATIFDQEWVFAPPFIGDGCQSLL